MLESLKQKHGDKNINLICGDYFTVDFGENKFDCAISFQTMYHFSYEKKIEVYTKTRNSLTDDGIYIECDYMVETQEEEDFFTENDRLRKEQNIPDDEFCHCDTPCTVSNQIMLLKKAGFENAEQIFEIENTTILIAKKS